MKGKVRTALLGVAAIGLAAGGGYAALRLQARAALRDADGAIGPRIAEYEQRRWSRPVLRGAAREGNAAALQLEAAAPLSAIDPKLAGDLPERVRRGEPLPAALLAEANARAPALASMRASTQAGWSYSRADLRTWPDLAEPRRAPTLRGWELLLARALGDEPGECLRVASDVIRMGQDLAPGASLSGAVMAAIAIEDAAPVAIRCAQRADAATRVAAIAELRALIAAPPPTGRALADDWLATVAGTHRRISSDPGPNFFSRFRDARAMDEMARMWTTADAVTAADYPQGLQRILADEGAREGSKNALVQLSLHGNFRHVLREARAEAVLRALVVAITAIDGGASGPQAQAALADAALKDPFTGRALETEVLDGALVVYSRGYDGQRKRTGPEADDAEVVTPPAIVTR